VKGEACPEHLGKLDTGKRYFRQAQVRRASKGNWCEVISD
jgi:hypothetical protein